MVVEFNHLLDSFYAVEDTLCIVDDHLDEIIDQTFVDHDEVEKLLSESFKPKKEDYKHTTETESLYDRIHQLKADLLVSMSHLLKLKADESE